MSKGMRRWGLGLLLAVVAGGLLLGGWRWYEIRRYRRAMAEIEAEMEYGRNGTAARKLADLLAWKPDSDEAAYLLGTCEMARGRPETADEVWSRIPPGSPFAPKAILGRMQLQMERGRLADAEQIIETRWTILGSTDRVCPSCSARSTLRRVVSRRPSGRSRRDGIT